MEGNTGILKRFIIATIMISAFLLIFNYLLLSIWVLKEMRMIESPASVVQNVAEGLQSASNSYSLTSSSVKLLRRKHAWAMLIDQTGHVVWSYMLPNEIAKVYSLTDIAKFTQSFLMNYPVFVWEHEKGLLVVGYPKNSVAKYQYILPTSFVSNLPVNMLILFIFNIVLALIISLIIGKQLIHSILPLTRGIQALAEDKETYVEPNGILANLAQSVNKTSALLQKKNHSLRKRDEARSNWIAGISHDIRTPLSMILGYSCELEENHAIPAEQRRQAGIMRQQAENLRSLVSDLNLVSLLEYEMQPMNLKRVRLSVLARQIASEFLNNELEERFSLEVDIMDENIQISGDERLLKRAIINLVQNSINHNSDGCRIKLQTYADASHASCHFIVEDDGKGIAYGELSDLLELPYSANRKYHRSGGHGLGLPMAAKIAKAHQGKLMLSSDQNKGFRSEMILPML